MSPSGPTISVIVATKNRAHAILSCLDSIVAAFQTADYTNGEIVVIDNASTDDTSAIVTHWKQTCPLPVVVVREMKPGVSAARNRGITESSGELIVFTDDDCHLTPSYIRDALNHDRNDTVLTMRSGSVYLGDPRDLPLTIRTVVETSSWIRPMSLEDEGQLLGNALIGCNVLIRKEAVLRIGVFDERLGPGTPCCAAEDSDYIYRAYLAGVRLQCVPDLAVKHFHGRRTDEQKQRLLTNYAIGNGALAAKYLFIYPRFSRHFYWMLKNYVKQNPLVRVPVNGHGGPLKDEIISQAKGAIAYYGASRRNHRRATSIPHAV